MKDVTIGNQQATQIEIGWLAGIIDGEGYLGMGIAKDLRGKSPTQQVRADFGITNTDEKIVLETARILKKLGINCNLRVNNALLKGNHKVVYNIGFNGRKKLLKLLPRVIEHLIGNKKERAQLMLAFCKSRQKTWIPGKHSHPFSKKELELIDKCCSLQRRGASETIRKAQLERSTIANLQKEKCRNLRETHDCDNCGKPIIDSPSRFKDHEYHFCNPVCRVKYQIKNGAAFNHPRRRNEEQAVMI